MQGALSRHNCVCKWVCIYEYSPASLHSPLGSEQTRTWLGESSWMFLWSLSQLPSSGKFSHWPPSQTALHNAPLSDVTHSMGWHMCPFFQQLSHRGNLHWSFLEILKSTRLLCWEGSRNIDFCQLHGMLPCDLANWTQLVLETFWGEMTWIKM